jgi:nitric oxide reductase NorE protein
LSKPAFTTPPGGILVWGFILMELLVFGAGFIVFFVMRAADPDVFEAGQAELGRGLAIVNTLVLLTSGYFVLLANQRFDAADVRRASHWLFAAAGLGALFVALKSVEYADKIERGLTTATDQFFEMYWLLTGFHVAHVMVGIPILLYFAWRIRSGPTAFEADLNLQTGSAFWHMCDLIWVLLLPTVYLV